MMVMTAKVNLKKMLIALAVVAGLILAIVLLLSGGKDTAPTAGTGVSDNSARVAFLKGLGWEVAASPTESGQVRIPEEPGEVFSRYNDLQKSQGYDLSQYGGKSVMRYVYRVTNYPDATQPVYATLLVYKNQVIGGDVTDTAEKGVIQGLLRQSATDNATESTEPATTAPTDTTTAPTE